jgi:excisionase family DNA binding protein
MENLPTEREWLTYRQAGELVGLSRTSLWQIINAGEVQAARVGRAVRINRQSLLDFMRRSSNLSSSQ